MRIGAVYYCRKCDVHYHVSPDGSERIRMTAEDSPLAEQWNAAPLVLKPEMQAALIAIGASPTHPTPPNRETPCAVTTSAGEHFPCAIVREQAYPPLHYSRHPLRLGSEIAKVEPSPYALPLKVRRSTASPVEVYKNVYETEIVMPDGSWLSGGGSEVFLADPDYDATTAMVPPRGKERPKDARHGNITQQEAIMVFIVDPFTAPKQDRAD
ncbi:hypothetical protein HFP51_01040 [Parasphingopyxis sp. CP4]|uniref:hypothetical protein n=1 Tax=Parasphingopyxis sp. CP4 TaxID=2724527 RepID=UPI0015A23A29|nr:hypothetical protein [Parasphingopyxis sp. CP4]QLC20891.1 hypothetical protein HFP51_01040 [Parasphingopyxis sp. CP4]